MGAVLMAAPREGNTTQRRLPSHVFREPRPSPTGHVVIFPDFRAFLGRQECQRVADTEFPISPAE